MPEPGEAPRTPTRFPRRVYDAGAEPDPRFSLANERTFLAWTRTALALIAAGVALEALALPLHPGLRLAASLVLLGMGVAVPGIAWIDWARTEKAMRHHAPLPGSLLVLPLAVTLTVVAALVLLAVVVVT